MGKSLQTWKNSVFGKRIDFDNASYDCVDVSKSWIMYLTDKNWTEVAGWGNAKDIYSFWKDTFLSKVPRGNAPQLGDIVVMNGQVGGGYGHTGVVVGIDGRNITIYQQNTFTQQAVYTGVFDAYASYITGFLRPKVAFSIGNTPLEAYQRVPVTIGARYREKPSTSAKIIDTFTPPEPVNFKGFVRGESVDGSNIWFVGRFTGGYSHNSGYTDSSTNGLPDLTPVVVEPPKLTENQRQVGSDAMNIRSGAKIDTVNPNVVGLKQPSEIITVKGYVRGQNVDGNDIWFVLEDGNYTWSGGYTNSGVGNLPDMTPKPPVDEPKPQFPAPTVDPLVTKIVNKKHPIDPLKYAPTDLVDMGNGQKLRKEAADSMALMQAAATAAGAGLVMGSGYRSYDTQVTIYNNYVAKDGQEAADRYSARPGHSEHQTGLTMDFSPIEDTFKNTPQYKWLTENAHKYGWVLRYPADKEDITGYMSEPWHWRYVGVTAAAALKTSGKTTLEEYYNVPGGKYPDPNSPPDEEPKPPAPADEAAKSATAFVARVTSQLAAAAIVVNGLAGLLEQYAQIVLSTQITGSATVLLGLAIVAYSQYKYKTTGGTKGWWF